MGYGSKHQCVIKHKNVTDKNGDFIEIEFEYDMPEVITSDIGWQLMTGWRNPPISGNFQHYNFPQFEIIKT